MDLLRFRGDKRRSLIYRLIKSWDEVLRDLEKIMGNEELPYVYGERPNIGILATAATRIGYVPFEEYSVDKRRGRKIRSGRADLWVAEKTGVKAYDFEAKYVNISFNSRRVASTVKHHLDIASKDASCIRYKSECTIGTVFVRPYGASYKNFDPEPFWEQLSDVESYAGDFCAFHIADPGIWAKNYYNDCPGIAIVGRYV